MAVHVQKEAPAFTTQAVVDGEFKPVSLVDYKGKYVVLFFYPLDFTFVCPTEIIAFSDRVAEFQQRGVQVLGCSTDSRFSHKAWIDTPRTKGGLGELKYPLLEDLTKSIATNYGVLIETVGICLRGLFLIDKNQIVRHITINDGPLGRSVDEILRLVDALQHFEKHGEVCPADWKPGSLALNPKKASEYFEKANAKA